MANFTNGADADFNIGCTSGVTTIGPEFGVLALKSVNTERARIDSSGRLLVGTSTSRSGNALIQSASDGTIPLGLHMSRADQFGPSIYYYKSRGSLGSASIVANGDTLGVSVFNGYDGANYIGGATIAAEVDGTPGVNDLPTRLVFSTTADGAASPTERMRIDRNGVIDKVVGVYNNTTASAANLFIGAAGDFNRSTSSGKYKTQVEDIEYQYSDALLNCRPVWYRSTCKGDNPNHGWWGFIAEEVAAIDSRLVHWKTLEITYDEKGSAVETSCDPEPEGVAYDRFVPHLLNLIKRQKEQIEAMETRLAALEAS
jgi:hypothetical protein